MRPRRWLVASIGVLAVFAVAGAPAADSPKRVKLLVLLVFDQFRGDYLARWDSLFVDDGFRRLKREGTWFTNCHYPYAGTITGPGHASLSTGCSPDRHGIIGNDWFDRSVGGSVYCATTDRYRTVYSFPPQPEIGANGEVKKPKDTDGGSPDRMVTSTFAETLKDATGGKSTVVAVSLKDRSAVLPGGRKADACYWFNDRTGTFVTSTFYRDHPQSWVNEFNAGRPIDRWFNATWTRLRPEIDYDKYSGPDDVAAEAFGIAKKQGRIFPHPMNGGLSKPGKEFFDTVETSPYGNDLVLEFALRALEAENLGHHDATDFFSVSFSSNDLIGHNYGPDSHEVMDVTLRSDLIVRDLLNALDRRVGKGNYLLAMSADHGVCPIPEVSMSKGRDAKRIDAVLFAAKAVAHLSVRYGAPLGKLQWIESQAFPWIYLNHRLIEKSGFHLDEVTNELADYLRLQEGVQAVYTRKQLESAPSQYDEPALKLMRKSYFPSRCGDLAVVSKPYYLFTTYQTGTSHGTPHLYDTHVPLVVYGPGVPTGTCDEAVTPQAVVPIFSWAAGIAPPATAEAPLPARIRGK